MPRKRVFQEVIGCARCGGDHARLLRREFPSGREPMKGWGYWMRCPVTGAPIMLKVKNRG